ncbi:MAG: tetratricopeptide repeat protein [Candidatus Zixiibacteriota bacterium]|nr:MAG: tetratricopeptide repeat protein [candidate division Zixibacteria bacterium]
MSGFEIIVGVATIIAAILAGIPAVQWWKGRKKSRSGTSSDSLVTGVPTDGVTPPRTTAASPTPSVIPAPPEPYFAHRYFMPGNFTGRVAERNELTAWFVDTHDPMFVYEAIGGMGKSAVTWYWLHEDILKSDSKPDGVIWWSFYEKESRFETFLEKALIYVTQDGQKVKAIPSTYDRMEWLRQLLCKKRYMIILDGLERILRGYAGLGSPYQGDEVPVDKKDEYRACVDPNAGLFLQWVTSPDLRAKTLITSRLFPKELDGLGGCRHKFLDRLHKDDAVVFFQQQGIKGTHTEIEAACDAYGYHPLSLRLLSGMIRKDPRHACDIAAWTRHNPLPDEKQREHHILELAYHALDKKKQKLISELAAFRNPMTYESMAIFQRDFGDQQEFDAALIDLVDRGLLLREPTTNKYDLHPIIRRYCYDRLTDKEGVHSQLRDYFKAIPQPEKIESLADLDSVIELYHHTVNSSRYDEALELLVTRLIPKPLYFRFGAYGLCVELLLQLFPDGEDKPPRLSKETDQGRTLNDLSASYTLSGQPRKAISLIKSTCDLSERLGHQQNLAIDLYNLGGLVEFLLGRLDSAELNLRKSISICQKIKDKNVEAVGHNELGHLLAYRGRFEESTEHLAKALKRFEKLQALQSEGVVWSYRAQAALLTSYARQALDHAKKARELADAEHVERDIILAEWLLGAAYLACGNLNEVESHLNEALQRDRRINMVDLEVSILLELAKLRHAQKRDAEALKLANEALTIADRCEYRLQQAEIHNFLAQYYFDTGDKANARVHAEIAKERAECGYVPALDQAKALLAKLS